ncbi:hemolysin [Pseudobdellovibrio exovorus JSS]|uniref:Hemolysin n=1 Tax=Pseudobdellovibrio exovorus JSS TaxID=1184267 RepID=M4VBE2_9BACT|nr:hemolysin [Pseudobdellovibrio exovorus JSS]
MFLVQNQLASSRTQAQALISEHAVYYVNSQGQNVILNKSSFEVSDDIASLIQVHPNDLQKYVSRAGLKLESALEHLKLNVAGLVALDVGQSTGGFTNCLLQHKVKRVVGLDVGHDQLHPTLKNDPRVVAIEGLNAKDIEQHAEFKKQAPAEGFDLMVMDVSFISLTKVVPYLKNYLKPHGQYLFLVKPQFECGAEHLDKNGVVKNKFVYTQLEENIRHVLTQTFGHVQDYFASGLSGKDGNQEFFIYGKNLNG